MDPTTDRGRRRVLAALGTGIATGLAGCTGGTDENDEDTPEPVPGPYETATSIAGVERDPGRVAAKETVAYQPGPSGGRRCAGCQFYVPDRNGDGLGACAVVEGTIDPDGWCTSYAAHAGTATPTDERGPVSIPDSATCPVCNMVTAEHPAWNAQLRHADGERAFFDTSGCLVAYYALPGRFAATDASIAGVWVTDFETGERIDGTRAHYALETDPGRVDDPMGRNPAPFADRADAVAYVDAVDYLTTDDVVGIEAFDRDLAELYRGRLLTDG